MQKKIQWKPLISILMALAVIQGCDQQSDEQPAIKPPVKLNQILFHGVDSDGDYEIFKMKPDGTHIQQLTKNQDHDYIARFSPDGKQIVYERNQYVWLMNSDGSNPKPIGIGHQPTWSPDGSKILYTKSNALYEWTQKTRKEKKVMRGPSESIHSPDWSISNRIAFVSSDDGYVIGVADTDYNGYETKDLGDRRCRYSYFDAHTPRWSADGKKLAFISENQLIVANKDFSCSSVADAKFPQTSEHPSLAFSPDGHQIVYSAIDDRHKLEIWRMNVDGSNKKQLTHLGIHAVPSDWR